MRQGTGELPRRRSIVVRTSDWNAPAPNQKAVADAAWQVREDLRKPSSASSGTHAAAASISSTTSDADGIPASLTNQKMEVPKRRVPRWAKVAGIIAALLLVSVGLFACYLNSIFSLGDRTNETRQALTAQSTGPFYMLVMGTDSRNEDSDEMGRPDVIMLTRVDPKNSVVTAVSIPRDTPWVNAEGKICKINDALMQGGPSALIQAVQGISGVQIAHYVEVDYGGFSDIIDALGGITVDVPVTVGYKDAYTGEYIEVPQGTQTLNGQQATILARARHEYGENQEAQRQSMVRVIVQAMLEKTKTIPLQDMPGVVTTVGKCINTDFELANMAVLLPSFLDDITYYSASGPYAGDFDEAADGQWLCYENPQGWARLMSIVDAGEDPSGISYDEDVVTIPGTDIHPE